MVLEDADVEKAVDQLMVAKYRNNGASCIAANNVWVHRRVWELFVAAYLERSLKLRLGDPLDEAVDLGPVRTPEHVERLGGLIEEARATASETMEGDRPSGDGFFVPPAVLVEPDPATRLWREEIFGPVTPVRPFTDIEEVIEDCRASAYGLAGYMCTTDPGRALELGERMEIGVLGVNVPAPNVPQIPFGGFKESGFGGYEGGRLGLEPFIEYQSVAVSTQ